MPRKLSKISIDILKVIAITGVVAIAATSPYFLLGLFKVLAKENKRFSKNYSTVDTKRAMHNLKRAKLVIWKEKDGRFFVELTKKGKRKFKEVQIDELKSKKPADWDGFWRIIIFDIPERQKYGRAALRGKMKELGFCQLQKSVWAFPYDCEKEIELLSEIFEINEFINYIVAKSIKDDKKIKKHFHLS